ncbi:MAG: AAA family ATPase [Patescibacteria group bacterium]|nr:AAA family ATPase [Patescibacteria group bacterium]
MSVGARAGYDLLRYVWGKQPGEFIIVSAKQDSKWQDQSFRRVEEAIAWLRDQDDDADLYWCPTKFNSPRRKKESVAPTVFGWADLDFANPWMFDDDIRPSIAWESSPGRYHALWELTEATDPRQVELMNKSIAYAVGADKSGWDLTQVLRIPGTKNHKYSPPVKVRLLWQGGKLYRPDDLMRRAAGSKSTQDETPSDGGESFDLNAEQVLVKYKHLIPRKILRLLLQDEVTPGQRSDILWSIEHELASIGLKKDEIITLIQASAWNKYKGRSDEHKRLEHEVAQAFLDAVGKEPNKSRTKPTNDEDSISTTSLTILNDTQLMGDIDSSPGWLVEGFWSRRSHGIVAGEPKSFKSTLVMDLAVSVSSGEPFLNQFAVHEVGPVVIIQNENATWIMKDRLAKIRASKGLIGNVKYPSSNIPEVTFAPELPIYYVNQQAVNLSDPVHQKLIEKLIGDIKPVLTIFDPLYLMFDGDVNSAKDLNPVLSWLLRLKNQTGTGLLVIHHWNKGGASARGGQRMLGSTTLHGWIESAWYISIGNSDEEPGESDVDITEGVNDAGGRAVLTIEREFRGMGLYPKIDVTLEMNEDSYASVVDKHMERGRKGRRVDRDTLTEQVLTQLGLRGPLSVTELTESLGVSRRVVTIVVKKMTEERMLKKKGMKYSTNNGR